MAGSTLLLFVRLLFSLGVVIMLMWGAAVFMKRRGIAPGPGRRQGRGVQVELLARRPLGRNTSIAVVRVGERALVVGVTDHNVTKLDEADVEDIELIEDGSPWTAPSGSGTPGPGTAWKAMLELLRDRTVRR